VRRALLAVLLIVATQAGGVSARAEDLQLPNLVPLPPFDIQMAQADAPAAPGQMALRFSVGTENLGRYALDVLGLPETTDSAAALQCVSWIVRACQERREIGKFVFDAVHAHFHFANYSRYELRRFDGSGNVDTSAEGLVAGGKKVSFCLTDTEAAEGQPPSDNDINRIPAYRYCPLALQGISSWWEDIYTWPLEGQQVDVSGVADGVYALFVVVNPDRMMIESGYEDNTSFATIELSGNGTQVTRL
jgi:hypothetical protein